MTKTAAADSRIATLAKRAKLSSMNMPWKAMLVVPSPDMATQAASSTITTAVTQTSTPAALSFDV